MSDATDKELSARMGALWRELCGLLESLPPHVEPILLTQRPLRWREPSAQDAERFNRRTAARTPGRRSRWSERTHG